MHDILLRNALIADPEADSLRTGDVAVEGGCIVEAIGSACTTIDCSGLVLQPGIIDTHVHLGINPLSSICLDPLRNFSMNSAAQM